MPDSPARRLRLCAQPGYSDTAALNDIHALLTTAIDAAADLIADIGLILARTGRPMIRGRHIEVRISETQAGWPAAHVDAADTAVTVRQDPAGPGLLIEITTSTPGERDRLTVTVDGQRLRNAGPHGGDAA